MDGNRGNRTFVWQVVLLALLIVATAVGFAIGRRSRPAGQSQPALAAAPMLWTCSMHPQIIRKQPGRCPICHMELTPLRPQPATTPAASSQAADPAERKIKFWWDPGMSPPYIADQPGKSPAGADLVPVYDDEIGAAGPDVVIESAAIQNMGVRTAHVTEGPLKRSVRALGALEEAQPNIHDVNLRVSGWIRQLFVTSEGQHVEAGEPLFDLYSPEFTLAVEELIAARKAAAQGGDSALLFDAAVRRLDLLGLDKPQIDAMSRLDKAPEAITFRAPVSGHVTEKPIVEGMAVKAGERALRLVDHTTLWIDAQVFEKDLPFMKIGAKASATVASRPRNAYDGEVIFIHPHVDMTTRAATVRMEVRNAGLALKPGMYATVRIDAQTVERAVMAPREAVIDSGDAQVVLVAKGGGHFEPRRVKVGLPADDGMVQIVAGLAAGEEVVTSGQFLIDSESRLRESVRRFESGTASPPIGASIAAPAVAAKSLKSIDAVVRAYLDIADALGAEQKQATPLHMDSLIAAAKTLKSEATGSAQEPDAVTLAEAAERMRAQTIDQQRTSFKKLSESMIALVDAAPPSRAIGEKLYVMECPMFPGRWIQRTEELANPFYATDMKECGSHVKVISTGEKGNGP